MASLAHTPTDAQEERRANPAAPPSPLTTVWSGMDADAPLVALLTKCFCTNIPIALVSVHMTRPGIARTTYTPLGSITILSEGQLRHTSIVGSIPIRQIIRLQVAAPTQEGRAV